MRPRDGLGDDVGPQNRGRKSFSVEKVEAHLELMKDGCRRAEASATFRAIPTIQLAGDNAAINIKALGNRNTAPVPRPYAL